MKFNIHWPIFWLFFGIGIAYIILTTPKPTKIYKFPTPFNARKVTYRDAGANCYQYDVTKVACPANAETIKTPPITE